MSRYARRVDTSHAPIREALRKAGLHVVDTSRVGGGFPDLLIAARGRTLLLEIKSPRNRAGTVTPSRIGATQTAFARCWPGDAILMATSPDRAVAAVLGALGD